MDVDVASLDFTFMAPDDEGEVCCYEALLSFVREEGGVGYLVYADLVPAADATVGTYVSRCDLAEVEQAQEQVERGGTPKELPVLSLSDPQGPEEWEFVEGVLDDLEAEGDN